MTKTLREEVYKLLRHSLPDNNTNVLSWLAIKIEKMAIDKDFGEYNWPRTFLDVDIHINLL